MSHLHTCHFCDEVACEVYSFQVLTPSGRVGVDLYECGNCKVRYVFKNHEPVFTNKTRGQLLSEVYKKAEDRMVHPEKYMKEQKAYDKNMEGFKQSDFGKALKKGMDAYGKEKADLEGVKK